MKPSPNKGEKIGGFIMVAAFPIGIVPFIISLLVQWYGPEDLRTAYAAEGGLAMHFGGSAIGIGALVFVVGMFTFLISTLIQERRSKR